MLQNKLQTFYFELKLQVRRMQNRKHYYPENIITQHDRTCSSKITIFEYFGERPFSSAHHMGMCGRWGQLSIVFMDMIKTFL